ncbi:hypothetical protein M5W83_18325 [Paenibacillus thiaminolyticus]|uniref:Uncharacterized protein n=1 Tax=Paenibacillus thiaminolyticus TaxID=49283 RepID=A0ABT4FY74_PANTH|nr:hypothetical protein [Paenibacillus thiaminolyticus]MCY9534874.1 hypothetical protein [Paenibacillus thiaminolyticus]MCY9604968.1 hypothetical protein [Paenibacillus thiaminolyticus]MCY9609104.1 hypothetical protein [Paenibacillus thiaminolyticus]MCY9616630.1 hypothetical protein [Paenibacillus thiaminolyticus]MCY9621678.1 hypothetical protein [Paenibacillus thiaminolyticus]
MEEAMFHLLISCVIIRQRGAANELAQESTAKRKQGSGQGATNSSKRKKLIA